MAKLCLPAPQGKLHFSASKHTTNSSLGILTKYNLTLIEAINF
jgi:hypothetical protein